MKLFGSTKKAKHSASPGAGNRKKKPSGGKKAVVAVLATLAVVALAAVVYVKTQVRPPDVVQNPNRPDASDATGPTSTGPTDRPDPADPSEGSDAPTEDPNLQVDTQIPEDFTRKSGVYTFLALGRDKMSGSTDTIMAARFDVNDHSLNIVSIPRDTLINVPWTVKKINTVYSALYSEKDDSQFLGAFADVLGFQPDFYGIVNLNAFIKLVDAIGGVDYYVPQNMNYEDPEQGLYIHFNKGQQRLNGQQAMEYMRFRAGYDDQDIGRIHAQQSFLTAAAKQILENANSVPISTLIDIVLKDVKTSLDAGECGWFAKELLKMDFENIHFYTMPGNYNDWAFGGSYSTVEFNGWREMVNEYLNPFNEDLPAAFFDMVARDSNGSLYATSGNLKVYG